MYYFFLDKMQLPVPPAALSTVINGQNKTLTLINEGEINIIKQPGLTEIEFDFLIPHTKYPFASYGGDIGISGVLAYLERLKARQRPFQFIVARMGGAARLLHSTNIKVTLETYSLKEDADNGLDMVATVRLKQYRPYSTKVLETDANGKTTVKKTRG